MQKSTALPGFREFVQEPLERHDPRSCKRIKAIHTESGIGTAEMFSHLLRRLTGRTFANAEAKELWRRILSHKRSMEARMDRSVSIVTAISDYFDVSGLDGDFVLGEISTPPPAPPTQERDDEWVRRALAPGYHLEKLKEEMMRVRRYKHALSAILYDLDNYEKLDDVPANRLLVIVAKITRKTIRTVDIVARCCAGRFMVILPDTNQREARELANRLRHNIRDRTRRVALVESGATITASVGQYVGEETSSDFVRRLEMALDCGEAAKRDAVYVA